MNNDDEPQIEANWKLFENICAANSQDLNLPGIISRVPTIIGSQ